MVKKIDVHFKNGDWKEQPSGGGTLALRHSYGTKEIVFDGQEMKGKGFCSYTLAYHPGTEATATYDGQMVFHGTVLGKEGSVVFREHGQILNGKLSAIWTVIPQAATGELLGMSGRGAYEMIAGKSGLPVKGKLEVEFGEVPMMQPSVWRSTSIQYMM